MSDKVREIMAKPGGGDDEDVLYLFFPETERGRAAGRPHLANVAQRLDSGVRAISDAAARWCSGMPRTAKARWRNMVLSAM